MDGSTEAIQDRVRYKTSPSASRMMIIISSGAFCILSIFVIASGELLEFFDIVKKYPTVLWWILAQTVFASMGQIIVFLMIALFEALLKHVHLLLI